MNLTSRRRAFSFFATELGAFPVPAINGPGLLWHCDLGIHHLKIHGQIAASLQLCDQEFDPRCTFLARGAVAAPIDGCKTPAKETANRCKTSLLGLAL